LFTLGVSGAWIGSLTALEPYRPIFVGLTVLFLAGAFHRLYLAHQVCTPGSACADPRTLKRSRMIILDRCDTGAWPDRHTVACPAILLTMRSTRFILIIGVIALPWTLFAGNLETVALDVKNMTCAVCPITVKKALEKVPGVTRADVGFQ